MTDLRHELKFVVDERLMNHLYNYFNTETSMYETWPPRFVNSLYFDDALLSSALNNLAGLSHRAKNRFRWYSDNNKPDNISGSVAFEIKIKNNKLSSKTVFALEPIKINSSDFIYSSISLMLKSSPIILNAVTFTEMPTLHVQYFREYYETRTGIRITFDSKLRFFDAISSSHPLIMDSREFDSYVVELKFPPDQLSNVAKLIKGAGVTPVRHSKYLRGLSLFGYFKYL